MKFQTKVKKLVSLLLSLLMLVSVFTSLPVTAGAATTDKVSTSITSGDFEYSVLDDGTIEINKYTGSETKLEIPGIIDGYTVTRIGNSAFYECEVLKSATIPERVTSIGWNAFERSSLESITFPEGVTEIGSYAFSGTNLASVKLPKSLVNMGICVFRGCGSLTSVHIPTGISYIGDSSWNHSGPFDGCPALKNVTFEEGITKIPTDLFLNCNGIEKIVIPDSVTEIGGGAFSGCTNLSEVVIPDSVTKIGGGAFYGCTNLTEIVLPDGIMEIGGDAFSRCTNLTEVVLSDSITEIGNGAFGYTNLSAVKLPKSLKNLGLGAFESCKSLVSVYISKGIAYVDGYGNKGPFENCLALKNVTFEDGIDNIPEKLFLNCDGIEKIVIPDTVTKINSNAFSGCTNLTEVTIPDSVTEIGGVAFSGCTNLTEVIIPDGVIEIGGGAFSGCTSLTEVVLSDSITEIGNGAFGYTNLSAVKLPKSLKNLGLGAFESCKSLVSVYISKGIAYVDGYGNKGPFENCSDLKTVTFEDGIDNIPEKLFLNCDGIGKIVIPDTVTKINSNAFSGCTNLTEVTIPNSVVEIGDSAFSNCTNLTEVIIPDSVERIKWGAFSGCTSLIEAVLPDSLTEIGSFAFYNTKLLSVNLPKSLKKLGRGAFESCKYLVSVYIPKGITDIDGIIGPFDGCSALKNVTFEEGIINIPNYLFLNCDGIEKIVIPDTVTGINYSAFSGCTNLTEVTIPNSVVEIGDSAFSNCTNLTEVIIPDSVERIKWGAFGSCTNLTKADLPDSLTEIGNYAFGSTNLLSVNLPESLKDLGRGAFWNCKSLVSVYIPNGNIYVGSSPFEDCSALKNVTFGEGITYIPNYLFLNCDGIEKIVIPDTVTKIGYSAFSGCTNLTEVTVPDSVTEIGRTAFSECTSLTEIIIPDNVIEIGYQCFGNCPSLSIYCRKFSKSAIAAIDSGANILFYDENRREDTKVLDVGKSYFIKQTSDVVKLTCNYSIKDEAYEDINNISIKIKTPPNAEFVQNSLFLDKNLCDNYRENNDSIIVPVVNQSGKITLNFRVKESGVFATYALLNYNFDGVSDYDIIDVISDDKSIITINTDSITNKAEIDVEGVAPSAGDNIVVYVDDTVITTLKANKAADYSGKVSLPDTQDGNTYKIKAVSKTTGDSAETKVMYKENAPKLLSFKMIYKDCEYDLMSNKKHSITYNGANPFTFIVEYENYSGIDTVIVGSTRNQDTKIMKAKWDDELKAYVAQGYFEDADTSYVPGTLSVSYTEKQDDFELNQEWVDEQLEVELPEKLQNYTTEKIENTDTYKEYNISFSDDAEIKYIYEQVSVSDMLSELEEEEEQPQSVAALRTSDKYKLSTGDTGDIIKLIEKITFKGWKLYKKYGTGQEETGYSKIENSGGDIISWWYDPNADYIEKQVISAVKDKSLDYIVDTMVPQAGGFTDLASPMFGTMQSMGAEYLNFCGTVIDVQLAKQEIMMDTSLTDQQRQAKLQQLRDYQNAQLNITCAKIVGECLKYEAGLIAMSGNPIIGGIVWAAGFIIGDIYASNPDGLSKSVLRIKSYFSSPFNWCIDPSGYVYEGVTSNRLKGVTATAYWIPFDEEDEGYWDKPDEDKAIVWDSDEYSQYNPLITDYEGNYAWDVPEGWWRVKYELDGYETCYSEWMKVPPPQTDVNINMKKLANPQVESVCFTDTGDIEIEFDTYMLPETVSNVIVKDWSLNNVEYKLAYSNDETDAEGNVYAKVFTLDADVEMNENVISSITVPDTVLSYAQVSAKFYAKEFERPTEDTTAAESTESTTETDNVQDKLIGDVNLDGTVDIKDVTYIQKYLASLIFLNDYQLARADTNNDGNINIKDATAIQEFLVQLIPKLG